MVGIIVAVVGSAASLWPAAIYAGADQIGTARQQLHAAQAAAASGAERIRELTLAYDQANTQAAALSQQVAADQARMTQLQARVDLTRGALRADAIISYTGGNANAPSGSLTATNDPAVRAEYLQIAAGDIVDVVDQYRTQEAELATAEASLAAEEQASQAALQATDAARQEALSQAAAEQSQLDQLQGRLNQLTLAAALAAQAQPATQGLPVNGGLVQVVRNIVSPPPPPPPSAEAGGVWLQLRECESGNNYQANTGNGFYGAYQFDPQTWTNLGYPGRPDLEPPSMQDQAAQRLQAQYGWGQWPACSAALGLH